MLIHFQLFSRCIACSLIISLITFGIWNLNIHHIVSYIILVLIAYYVPKMQFVFPKCKYLLVSNALVIPFSLIILLSYQYYILEKHLLRVLMASTSISYVIYVYSECQYNVRGLPTQIFHVLFKKKKIACTLS